MRYSERVKQIIQAERISEEELNLMVSHSSFTSLRGFNRRYFHWLLSVEGDNGLREICEVKYVSNMQLADYVEVGKGVDHMMEEHEHCQGAGCSSCGWIGKIIRHISDKPIPRDPPFLFGVMKERANRI
jgi:hypothetical protein